MRALCWHGHGDVRVDTVPDPVIVQPTDVILKITSTAICGSDLHLLDGYMPTMESGDILGHEPMGIVVETGSAVQRVKKGDRVVVPFTIACGACFFCKKGLWAACDTTNPNAAMAAKDDGAFASGAIRLLTPHGWLSWRSSGVPARAACRRRLLEDRVRPIGREGAVLVGYLPHGYMAAENAEIEAGDTVAVWGCGPVGQFCIQARGCSAPVG